MPETAPPGHDPRDYPPFAVTADVACFAVADGELHVLLVERAEDPFAGTLALPGGFVREGEDLAAAARRELAEETALRLEPAHLEQLASYGAPDRDPRQRVVTVAYLAMLADPPPPRHGGDARAAAFRPVSSLRVADPDTGATLGGVGGDEVAFDHADILRDAVARLRAKLEYTPLAATLLAEPFTLSQLRGVYEAVWGRRLDAAAFRRNMLRAEGLLAPAVGEEGGEERYRRGPAEVVTPPLLRPAHPRRRRVVTAPSCGTRR